MSDLPEDAKTEDEAMEPQGAGESGDDQFATDSASPENATAPASEDTATEVSEDIAAGTPDAAEQSEAPAAGENPATETSDEAATDEGASDTSGEVASVEDTSDDEPAEEVAADEDAEDEAASKPKPTPPKSGLLEFIEEPEEDPDADKDWYILKVAVNREPTIAAALERRVKMHGLEQYFGDIIVPTEEQTEFTKAGKKRKVKKKLYPGYIVVNMAINDETWFLVRETGGIGDFTGAAGKPAPLQKHEIDRILNITNPKPEAEGETHNISHKIGDRVRVNEGYFQNFEGVVDSIDVNSGRVTVLITIFNRTAPVELEHWHIEAV